MLDTSDVEAFAVDLNRESVLVRRRTNAAIDAGIDYVYTQAIASAQQFRDTGDMIAATFKSARSGGYARIVRCTDPAGLMNEFGTSKMPPRPWLLVHADTGAQIVHEHLARDLGEFIR